jgi:hypothetical protein
MNKEISRTNREVREKTGIQRKPYSKTHLLTERYQQWHLDDVRLERGTVRHLFFE